MSAKRTLNNNKNTFHSKQILYNEVNGSHINNNLFYKGNSNGQSPALHYR